MKKRNDKSSNKDREIKKSGQNACTKSTGKPVAAKSQDGDYSGLILIGALLVAVMFVAGAVLAIVVKTHEQPPQRDAQVRNSLHIAYYGRHATLKASAGPDAKQITLQTPSKVLDSLKSVVVQVNEGPFKGGEFEIEISSFFLAPGDQLVFYGYTHIVSLSADGILELEPLTATEKQEIPLQPLREAEIKRADAGIKPDLTKLPISIRSCLELTNLQDESGTYLLKSDLNCNLSAPLFAAKIFKGVFDGQGHTLAFQLEAEGPAALFSRVEGTIRNLILEGSVKGTSACAGLAILAYGGSVFEKCSSSVRISCEAGTEKSISLGGFVGVLTTMGLQARQSVNFVHCISQASLEVLHPNHTAFLGAFFGTTISGSASFENSFVDSEIAFRAHSENQRCSLFGFLYNSAPHCPKGVTCVVNKGERLANPCCTLTERCPDHPDPNNCDRFNCYPCRGSSGATESGEASRSPILPNFQAGR